MREDMEAVFRGYADKGWGKENYVANILHRHVHQRTAALYAKNPKCQATRRKRLDYKFWDGDEKTLAEAYKNARCCNGGTTTQSNGYASSSRL